jgi:hypothetical protein
MNSYAWETFIEKFLAFEATLETVLLPVDVNVLGWMLMMVDVMATRFESGEYHLRTGM